jgi:hypothetical protein
LNELLKNVSLFGLAPQGVCLATRVTKRADELLPHRFTHHLSAGLFSVALVVNQFSLMPGRYPACCSAVFGLSSFDIIRQRLPNLPNCKAL